MLRRGAATPSAATRSPALAGGPLRRVVRESGLYGLSAASAQAVNVLLVPVYARILGLDGVGEVALLNTTSLLFLTLAGFSLAQAFFRSYIRDATDASSRAHVLAVTTTLRVLLAAIVVAGYFVIAGPLSASLIREESHRLAVYLIALVVLFDATAQGPLQWLRGERRPRAFAMLSVTRAVLAATLAVFAVVVLEAGIVGVATANVVAAAVMVVVGYVIQWRSGAMGVAWDAALARSMLRFSAPLVPAAVALWVLNLSDRFLLNHFVDATAVGIYVVGYTVGALVNLGVVQPFVLAWSAAKWDVVRGEDAANQLARFHRLIAATASLVALGVSALGVDALRLLVPAAADQARIIVPFSAFGYAAFAIHAVVSTGLTVRDRTATLGAITIAVGIANLVLNLLLIPRLGIVGAGISTLACYILLATVTAILSPRDAIVRVRFRPAVEPFLTGLILAFAAILGPDTIAWRLLCIAAFVPVSILAGWLRPEFEQLVGSRRQRSQGT